MVMLFSGDGTSDGTVSVATLTAQLTQKDKEMAKLVSSFENQIASLKEELSTTEGGDEDDDLTSQKKEIKKLKGNLALVQTELAQVQTEANQLAAMQQRSLATFKSNVFAEQEELNQVVLTLTSENETIKAQLLELQAENDEKSALIIELEVHQSAHKKKSLDVMVEAVTDSTDTSLSELSKLSGSCQKAMKDVVNISERLVQRENKIASVYNTPDSEAAMLSVKLSQLKDQFEVLTFKYQSLQNGVKDFSKPSISKDMLTAEEVAGLTELVSNLKASEQTHKAKLIEAIQSNDKLQADIADLKHTYEALQDSVGGQLSNQDSLLSENNNLRAEIRSYAEELEALREVKSNASALEVLVDKLENDKRELSAAADGAIAALDDAEVENGTLRKKINDFVALGDMREVGWENERVELKKNIRQLTQDINFMRQNEKRLHQEALLTSAAKRVGLDKLENGETSTEALVHVPESLNGVIDTTSRSRLAAERAIQSGDMESLQEELLHQVNRFEQLREHNAKLLQKIQQKSNSIQVCCRLRPPSEQELGQGAEICVDVVDDTQIAIYEKRNAIWKSFEFDKVWDEDSRQVDIFTEVEPLALTAVDGYNACILAYGMTGSGKTYTMNGYGSDYGVSYRVVHKIFELLSMKRTAIEKGVEMRQELVQNSRRSRHGRKMCASPIGTNGLQKQDSDTCSDMEISVFSSKSSEEPTFTKGATYTKQSFHFSVTVSMLEIYNETVKDLLNSDPRTQPTGGMDIRHDGDGNINVPGLISEDVFSLEDVMKVLSRGQANRATSSTNINEHSSRSHSILMINVTTAVNGGVPVVGKLCLVDLAGSERVERSGAQGRQLKEAQHINRSLSALGDVLEALENKSKHVPYRNSKLTYLLQDSLGGNSRTMMIMTVCPTELTTDESLFCLQFASRARKIQLDPSKRNVSWKTIEESLKHAKVELKEEKKKQQHANETIKGLKTELKQAKEKVSSQMGFKLKNIDESRKMGEQQVQVLTRTNAELMLRLQEEKEQLKGVYFDLETNEKALRRCQEQLKHCKAERDRILATQGYKDQENHNLREMVRLYEENEGDYTPHLQQENHQHNNVMQVSTKSKSRNSTDFNHSHSERERGRHSTGQKRSPAFSGGESMQRQPRYFLIFIISIVTFIFRYFNFNLCYMIYN
jgi:kinesin family protein C2/C3